MADRAELRRLVAALADRVEQLETERATTRRQLQRVDTALARFAADESQPEAARHVASVIGRQIAQALSQDG